MSNNLKITLKLAEGVAFRILHSKFLLVVMLVAFVGIVVTDASFLKLKELKETGELVDFADLKGALLYHTMDMLSKVANLIAMVIGSTVIRQDIKDGTIFSVLSKPVSRLQYFFASVLGSFACQTAVWLIFGTMWLSTFYFVDSSIAVLNISVCLSELLKSLLMLSLAIGFSLRFSPWIAAGLALTTFDGTSIFYKAVSALERLHVFPVKLLVKIAMFPFPEFSGQDALSRQLFETSLKPISLVWPVVHMVDYSLVVLFVAWLMFRRQDLTSNI